MYDLTGAVIGMAGFTFGSFVFFSVQSLRDRTNLNAVFAPAEDNDSAPDNRSFQVEAAIPIPERKDRDRVPSLCCG